MLRLKLAWIVAASFSLVGCGSDNGSSDPSGGGGTAGSGGAGTTGGAAGTSSGGQGGATPDGDASSGVDARTDTPAPNDAASSDRGATTDTTSLDAFTPDAARDATTTNDAPSSDSGSSNDASLPPSDGSVSDGGSGGSTDASGGDASSTFVLTSSAFVEGAMLPNDYNCAGTNVSPPLQWTSGPASTQSYAIVLTDKTNMLVHSLIYDIPANVNALAANVEKVANPSSPAGAKQVRAYDNTTYGYLGPCPGGTAHTYEYMVYAIDVAALPGVTTASTRPQVVTAIQAHDLASAALTVTSNAKMP